MENFTPLSALIGGSFIGLSAVIMLAGNGRIAGISGILGGAISSPVSCSQRCSISLSQARRLQSRPKLAPSSSSLLGFWLALARGLEAAVPVAMVSAGLPAFQSVRSLPLQRSCYSVSSRYMLPVI